MITVLCLDDQREYSFIADSVREALEKMLYTLTADAEIKKTLSGKCLYFDFAGKTYAAVTEG